MPELTPFQFEQRRERAEKLRLEALMKKAQAEAGEHSGLLKHWNGEVWSEYTGPENCIYCLKKLDVINFDEYCKKRSIEKAKERRTFHPEYQGERN